MALTPKTVNYKSPYRVTPRRTSSFSNYGNYVLGNVNNSRMQRINEIPQYYDDIEDPNERERMGTMGTMNVGEEQPAMNGYKWVRNQRGERVQVRSNLTAKSGNWFDLVR